MSSNGEASDRDVAIRVKDLKSYSVASDGSAVQLECVDDAGGACRIELPRSCLMELALAIPKILSSVLAVEHGGSPQRLVHLVKDWTVELAAIGGVFIFTFTTVDDFKISFSIDRNEVWSVICGLGEDAFVFYPPPPALQ